MDGLNDLKIENAILGTLILIKDSQDDILLNCSVDLFYNDLNKVIFRACKEINSNNNQIDLLTVSNKLIKNPLMLKEGGVYYLTQLISNIASGANVDTHIRLLKELYIKRKLILYFQKGIQDINMNIDIFDIFNEFSTNLDELFKLKDNSIFQIYDVIKDRLNEIENMKTNEIGLDTGIKAINQNIGGWHKSDLIILAGKTSMGKTAVSLYFAKYAAINNQNVLFFSLEMSKSQIADRLISLETGINSKKLKTNNLETNDWTNINNNIAIYENSNFKINDEGGLTIEQITSHSKIENKKNKVDLIVVDYIQLVRKSTNGNTNDQVAHISASLKTLAKKIDCPIIALSQLKRTQNEKPKLSDLRDSGAIEQDADIVIFTHRYDYEGADCDENNKNLVELNFAKNRNGEIGTVEIYRADDWSKFYESINDYEMPPF